MFIYVPAALEWYFLYFMNFWSIFNFVPKGKSLQFYLNTLQFGTLNENKLSYF